MKEDILEQLVDDYLKSRGFFTIHNVKFKPSATHPEFSRVKDSVHSDVDVIGLHPKLKGVDRVWVVSCKSWQSGFDPNDRIAAITHNKRREGREAWKSCRELTNPKWSDGLIKAVEELTGSPKFTYVLAVTKLIGDKGAKSVWEQHPPFRANLRENPIKILELEDVLTELYGKVNTTVAPSEIGRLLQIIKASGWKPTDLVSRKSRQN